MFKAVFLDVGGTLLHPGEPVHQVYVDILARHGITVAPEQARIWWEDARQRAGGWAIDKGQVSTPEDFSISADARQRRRAEMVLCFLEAAQVGESLAACQEEIQGSWVNTRVFHRYPEIAEVLAQLKTAGLLLVAVSNWESRLGQLLEAHEIRQYFDHVICSEAEGFVKPSPRLFETALERTGLRPDEVLHVGDHPEQDVQPAEALGIRAVLLQREGQLVANHAPRVRSLLEVVPMATSQALIRGQVEPGKGEAGIYTQLDWVRRQVQERLGFEHVPGTLNVRLTEPRDRAAWLALRAEPGIPLEPVPGYCAARCYLGYVEGSIPCGILYPLVEDYPPDLIEVIAPVSLRQNLALQDGSWVSLAITGRLHSSASN